MACWVWCFTDTPGFVTPLPYTFLSKSLRTLKESADHDATGEHAAVKDLPLSDVGPRCFRFQCLSRS